MPNFTFLKLTKPGIILLLVFIVTGIVFSQNNPAAEMEKKIDNLLAKMTLEEKIGQMQQMWPYSRGSREELKAAVKKGLAGSFLNAGDIESKNELQKVAVEESRLGIPLIFGRDVIHGYKTVFPIPLGQAASWNPEIARKGAEVAAREAASMGIHWTFAPMMDIARDPRWGRIAESLGEDPKLASDFAVAMVKGFQGKDMKDKYSIAACAKHFVGYGAAESGKDYNTTLIPENELRNIYLKPFHASANAGVATMMSAFNDLNGVPATGNKFTLRDILRDEWKWDGFVISDWGSMVEMKNHGFCEDDIDVAYKSAHAGIDMEMVSEAYQHNLKQVVESGKIPMEYIDEFVKNILRIKFRLGLFENPYCTFDPDKEILTDENLAAAKMAAVESVVMLQNNDNLLPLNKSVKSIAVIGPLADAAKDQIGCWAPDGNPENSITPFTSLKQMLKGKTEVNYAKGVESARSTDKSLFGDAVDAANSSDVVVMFMGEDEQLSGESHSRAFIGLPGVQSELIEKVSATGKPVVLVIMAGRPLTFGEVTSKVKSILYAWHPGTMGGPAIAELLLGKEAPSAKLPVSFPRTVGQVPVYYNHKNSGRPASPEILGKEMGTPENPVGFAAYYLDVDYTPAYDFGYGLTYTTFKFSDLKLSSNTLATGGSLEVSVNLENTGSSKGTEVVQLYIRDLVGNVTRPVKELKAYKKVTLDAGNNTTVKFTLTEEDLKFYNIENKFVSEPGKFHLFVGNSSNDKSLLKTEFVLTGK